MVFRLAFLSIVAASCSSTAKQPAEPEATAVATDPGPAASPAAGPASVKPGINDKFLSPDLDFDRWQKVFEGESREVSRSRAAIIAAMEIAPGMSIADIGAGTGLFVPGFAAAVGTGGKVYGVDISPVFLKHLRTRVSTERLTQVDIVAGTDRSVQLSAGLVDIVFVCDTYHHFEYPQPTLASIFKALKPGGALVIVDFNRIEGVTSKWALAHVRAGKQVFTAEIEQAGFRFEAELKVEGLSDNYMLRFRRPTEGEWSR